MANWNEKFNSLITKTYQVQPTKEWKLSLEENKSRGTLQMNWRLFSKKDEEGNGYEGPTKSGFIVPVNSLEDFINFKQVINEYFDECEKLFKED